MRTSLAPGGRRIAALAVAIAAIAVGATVATAAVTWVSTSTLNTTVLAPPVQFAEGNGASHSRFITNFRVSQDGGTFSCTIKAPAGADASVRDVVRLTSASTTTHYTITFTGDANTDPTVERLTWTVRNASSTVAVLNYKAASPSATFTLPAGQTFEIDLRVDLMDGAGRGNMHARADLDMKAVPQ